MNPIKLEALIELKDYADKLIDHLDNAIQNKFKNVSDFQIIPLKKIPSISFEDFAQECEENIEFIEQLNKQATNIGLTRKNRIWRKIEDICVDKDLLLYAGVTTVTMLASVVTAQWLGKCDDLLLIGPYPACDKNGELKKKIELKTLGKLELLCLQYDSVPGFIKVGAALGLGLVTTLFNKRWKDWCKDTLTTWRNKLRGGLYRNKSAFDAQAFADNTTFDDLIGMESVIEEMKVILKFIEDPERYARQKLIPEKGILFTGPSRTGKTFCAKALCGEIQKLMERLGKPKDTFKFQEITHHEIELFGFDYILQVMKDQAPCIIFIDEIDLLQLQATGNPKRLSEFSRALSGCQTDDPKKQVIVIGATNYPENLADKLRQHGRFGKEIRFEKPGVLARLEWLKRRLSGLAFDLDQFKLEKLAVETDGCVFEELDAIVKAACRKANTIGTFVDQELLEQCFDAEVRRIVTDNEKLISQSEIEVIAAQQIGTAVAHMLLGSKESVAKATVRPIVAKLQEKHAHEQIGKPKEWKQKETEHGGVFTYRTNDTYGIETHEDHVIKTKTLLAGNIAEKVLCGECGHSYKSYKKHQAFFWTRYYLASDGMYEEELLSKERKKEILDKTHALINQYEQELTELFEQKKKQLQLLVALLIDNKDLDGQTIGAFINMSDAEVDTFLEDIKQPHEETRAQAEKDAQEVQAAAALENDDEIAQEVAETTEVEATLA